jgi:hypothetical protein
MPFTLAHPVAALPLRRWLGRFGSISGLAVGSMIPDLAYFPPIGVLRAQSHSLAGIFIYCLPAGLLFWIAYRSLLRPFFLALAPSALAHRVGPGRVPAWSMTEWRAVVPSLVLGAATHVLWDSFTHGNGAMVRAIPALQTRIDLFHWYAPRIYTILQHASTLVGLTILTSWGMRWFDRTEPRPSPVVGAVRSWPRALTLVVLVGPALGAGLSVIWARWTAEESIEVLRGTFGRAVFASGTVFLVSLVFCALAWRASQPDTEAPREDARP